MTELDPDVADDVTWSDNITPYDEAHFITYLRLLDAQAEQADWRAVGADRPAPRSDSGAGSDAPMLGGASETR